MHLTYCSKIFRTDSVLTDSTDTDTVAPVFATVGNNYVADNINSGFAGFLTGLVLVVIDPDTDSSIDPDSSDLKYDLVEVKKDGTSFSQSGFSYTSEGVTVPALNVGNYVITIEVSGGSDSDRNGIDADNVDITVTVLR